MKEIGIGNRLKKERENKGLSFEKVTEELKIQPKFLQALEKEDFNTFPGETYAKAFLKTYAEYLGIKPEEVMNLYNESRSEKVLQDFKNLPDIKSLNYGKERKIVIPDKLKIIFLLFLGFIFLISLIFCFKSCTSLPKKPSLESINNELTTNLTPLILQAETTDEVWLQVTIDNDAPQEFIMKEGQTKEWEAREQFVIWIGNKDGIKLTYNGKLVDLSKIKSNVIKDMILKRGLNENVR